MKYRKFNYDAVNHFFPQQNEPSSDAFRLLGEVKFNLKDYEGSVAAYKSSATVSMVIICANYSIG